MGGGYLDDMDLPSSGSDYDDEEGYESESGGGEYAASSEQASSQSAPATAAGGQTQSGQQGLHGDSLGTPIRAIDASPQAVQREHDQSTAPIERGDAGEERAGVSAGLKAAKELSSGPNDGVCDGMVCSPAGGDKPLQGEAPVGVCLDTAPVTAFGGLSMKEQIQA